MKRFASILCIALLFFGCGDGRKKSQEDVKLTEDQNAKLYIEPKSRTKISQEDLQRLKKEYLNKFFAPFLGLTPNPNIAEVFWIRSSLKKALGYGSNLKKLSIADTQPIIDDMQISLYPLLSQKAIMVKDAFVRAVPNIHPRFSRPDGYPFDRWQNSMIFYGTPVLITHIDKTKRFAHIQTEFVYGWVEMSDLALVSEEQAKKIASFENFVMPKSDSATLYNRNGDYVTSLRIGKLFALSGKDSVWIYKRQSDGKLRLDKAKIDLSDFMSFPQPFSQDAMAESINLLIGQPYGWGGMNEDRDCSAFIRDLFSQFGLYLPRNSYAQGNFGTYQTKLTGLNVPQKEKVIFANATPFASVLYLKGHIMLYLGKNEAGELIVAHSAWSVNTSDAFSKIEHKLGGVVITTLKPASQYNGMWISSPTLGDRVLLVNDLYKAMKEGQ